MGIFNKIKKYFEDRKRKNFIREAIREKLDSIASLKEHLELNVKLNHKDLKEEPKDGQK